MQNSSEKFQRVYLPYCLQAVAGNGHVVLNRHYKPLGIRSTDWIDYAPYAVQFKRLGTTEAARLSWDASPTVDCIYLYNDGCVPTDSDEHWQAYQARLRFLAGLRVA